MIKIRNGVFETNSSSVHTLCIAQNDEIDKLKNEELLVSYGEELITYEEALRLLNKYVIYDEEKELIKSGNKEEIYHLMREYDIARPLEHYLDSEWLEPYSETITTEHGDRIMMFGLFGRG